MRRFTILTFFFQACFLCLGQDSLVYFFSKGDSLQDLKSYGESYVFFDSASILALEKFDVPSYVRALNGKGYALRFDRENPNYEGAFQFFYQALNLSRGSSIPIEVEQELYYGLAITERMRGNYDVAMEYGDLALILAGEIKDVEVLSRSHNMMANIYAYKGQFETAIENLQKAIDLRERQGVSNDNELPHWYYNLGIISDWMGSSERSNFYFKKAYVMFERLPSKDHSTMNVILQEIAKNFVDLEELDSAKIYYMRAQSGRKDQSEKGYLPSHHYHLMGNMHRKFSELDSALFYYQRAIVAGVQDFTPNSVLENPKIPDSPVQEWQLNPFLYEALNAKAEVLVDLYSQNSSIDYLRSGYELNNITINLLLRLRLELDENDPSLHLARHAKPVYDNALGTVHLLMMEQNEEELIASAFNYIEQIKHTILLKNRSSDYRIGEEFEFARRIKTIQSEIDELRRQIDDAKIDEAAGYQGIESLINQVISLRDEKQQLKSEGGVGTASVEYRTKSISEVKEYLTPDQLLISYFWGDSYLYGIAISNDESIFRRIEEEEVEGHLETYLSNVDDLQFDKGKESYDAFVESSHALYTGLVAPFVDGFEQGKMKELIVIPDGKINMLPFGSLLTQKAQSQQIDYRALDYLARDYMITYGFSSSLLTLEESVEPKEKKLVGFSSTLLQGTQKELENIESLLPKDVQMFSGLESTETNFKLNASNYEVIHIASHASAGDLNNQPNIAFSEESSSSEDGKLFSYEIYPLNLANELTVLSACETGLGKHYEGEGVFSLARGFAFAGSSAIVTSLWKVRDKQTTDLMNTFYRYLKDGETVKASLHKAQLDYIKQSDALSAHPSMWSSFVLIGNGNRQLLSDKSDWLFTFLLFIPILLSVFFFFRWRMVRAQETHVLTHE